MLSPQERLLPQPAWHGVYRVEICCTRLSCLFHPRAAPSAFCTCRCRLSAPSAGAAAGGDMTFPRRSVSLTPPLAAQQDAWQNFQRRSLDGDLERRASSESHSGPPLVFLAEGFDASPRPRQRRSLDFNR
jgi:hypothetical protein